MLSRIERQKQIRAQWESKPTSDQSQSNEPTPDVSSGKKNKLTSLDAQATSQKELKQENTRAPSQKQFQEKPKKQTVSKSNESLSIPKSQLDSLSVQSNNNSTELKSPTSDLSSPVANMVFNHQSRQSTDSIAQSPTYNSQAEIYEDSAFGSLVDPDENFDDFSIDEDSFAHDLLSISAKKTFWERKHREAIETERRRRETEMHLEKLRKRKTCSRWNDENMRRAHSFTSLASTDSVDGHVPTCELVENGHANWKTLSKIKVDDMKSHWNVKLLRSTSGNNENNNESSENDTQKLPGDKIVKDDIRYLKKREKEWQRQQRRFYNRPNSNVRTHYNFCDTKDVSKDEIRRTRSYSNLNTLVSSPSYDFIEEENKEQRKLQTQFLQESSVENSVLQSSGKASNKKSLNSQPGSVYIIPPPPKFTDHNTTVQSFVSAINGPNSGQKCNVDQDISMERSNNQKNNPTASPRLYSKRTPSSSSTTATTSSLNRHLVLKPTTIISMDNGSAIVESKSYGLSRTITSSSFGNVDRNVEKQDSSLREDRSSLSDNHDNDDDHNCSDDNEQQPIKEVLKHRTNNCAEKRRNIDKIWDNVCRKSEPKMEF